MPDIPYGTDHPEAPWIDRDGRPMDEPSMLAEMVSGKWLDAQQFPPLSYAVPGIVSEGFAVLVGPPKAGKSWLVAGIGLAVACGGRALGRIPVAQRPVLYLALEDGHRRLQTRFRRIMADQELPESMNIIIRAKVHEVIPMITEFLGLHADHAPLVILDTWGRCKPPRQPGEDAYAVDYTFGSRLKETIDSTPGAALVVVHHSRKAESADFVDAVSGTHGIAGAADSIIVLARKRHSDEALLSVTGRDVSEAEYALTTDDGLWRIDGDDLAEAARTAAARRDENHLGDRALEIVALVNRQAETRAADLTGIGITAEQGRVYLNRLADSGRIRKTGRGLYAPLQPPSCNAVTTVTSVTPSDKGRNGRNGHNTETAKRLCGCGVALTSLASIQRGRCAECELVNGNVP